MKLLLTSTRLCPFRFCQLNGSYLNKYLCAVPDGNASRLSFSQHTGSKPYWYGNRRAHAVITRYWEDLMLFGPLRETAKQKRQRFGIEEVRSRPKKAIVPKKSKLKLKKIEAPKMKLEKPSTIVKREPVAIRVVDSLFSPFYSNVAAYRNDRWTRDPGDGFVEKSIPVDDITSIFLSLQTDKDVCSDEETLPSTFPLLRVGGSDDFGTDALSQKLKSKARLLLNAENDFVTPDFVLPSVTSILHHSQSHAESEAYSNWKRNLISDIGVDKYMKYLKEIHKIEFRLKELIPNYLDKQMGSIDNPVLERYWSSLLPIFADISEPFGKVRLKVQHPFLHYQGILECIAKYRNEVSLIEWSMPHKFQSSVRNIRDSPLQLAAYIGAVNFTQNIKVDRAVLVVANPSGQPANVHVMSSEMCQRAWSLWLRRFHSYWKMRQIKEQFQEPYLNVTLK